MKLYKKLFETGCNESEVVGIYNDLLIEASINGVSFEYLTELITYYVVDLNYEELEYINDNYNNISEILNDELDFFCETRGLCKCCGEDSFRESIINGLIYCENCGTIKK